MRCNRCNRLCEAESATKFEGVYYGPECIQYAFADVNNRSAQEADLKDLLE